MKRCCREIFWLAAGLALAMGPRVQAEGPSREYQLKAAFLYNFVQFVEWPEQAFASANAPIVITVLGENPFGGAIEQVTRGKNIRGREITVRYASSASGIGPTHVLFVAAPESGRSRQVVRGLGGASILTVSDGDDFTAAGGVVRFFSEENKLRFEINSAAAGRVGLRLSAKLMQLARIYKEG